MLICLDGGFSTTLQEMQNYTLDKTLWGVECVMTNPSAVINVHKEFIKNGSEIITTNTYQASIEGISSYFNCTISKAQEIIENAVHLAKEALKGSDNVKVAGSVGPYGAVLLNGSEYSGKYISTIDSNFLKTWHLQRIECLINAKVDYIAFETIPSLGEAQILIDALKQYPCQKAWLSFSCKNDMQLCHGEYFNKAVTECIKKDVNKQLVAIGINCTQIKFITSLLKSIQLLRQHTDFIVYPNPSQWIENRWVGKDNSEMIQNILTWHNLGANFIGGCCTVLPLDIKDIKREIDKINLCLR